MIPESEIRVISDIFLGSRIISLSEYESGVEGRIYKIVTENNSFVVKFYSQTRLLYYPSTIKKVVELSDYLMFNGIPIPAVYKQSHMNECLCYYHINGEQIIPNEKELYSIALYFKRISECDIPSLKFLPIMSKKTLMQQLYDVESYEPRHNALLRSELMKLVLNSDNMTISHGDFHHGNMIWNKDHSRFTLIDWDEALIAPIEYDISRFFVSHSVYTNIQSANHLLEQCAKLMQVNLMALSFFIHYNAYYCLIRFKKWKRGFWMNNNYHSNEETKIILETLLEYNC